METSKVQLRLCTSHENALKLFYHLYKLKPGPLGNCPNGKEHGCRGRLEVRLSQALLLTSYTASAKLLNFQFLSA